MGRDVVVQRVRRVARVVVVVAGERQRVAVTRRDRRIHLRPRVGSGTGLRQHRRRGARGVVLQRGRRPVVGHTVRAVVRVPEGQRRVARRRREGLRDARVAVGRRRVAEQRAVRTRVSRGGDGYVSAARGPAPKNRRSWV